MRLQDQEDPSHTNLMQWISIQLRDLRWLSAKMFAINFLGFTRFIGKGSVLGSPVVSPGKIHALGKGSVLGSPAVSPRKIHGLGKGSVLGSPVVSPRCQAKYIFGIHQKVYPGIYRMVYIWGYLLEMVDAIIYRVPHKLFLSSSLSLSLLMSALMAPIYKRQFYGVWILQVGPSQMKKTCLYIMGIRKWYFDIDTPWVFSPWILKSIYAIISIYHDEPLPPTSSNHNFWYFLPASEAGYPYDSMWPEPVLGNLRSEMLELVCCQQGDIKAYTVHFPGFWRI